MEITNAAFAYLITPVHLHEGTLARLMGNAILAFFGAPLSHEHDPTTARGVKGIEVLCLGNVHRQ
jgi:class 3 adenylate cyclase